MSLIRNVHNRQLHPDEGVWIKSNANRYAEQQGITVARIEAELTAQLELQADAEAAKRYVENQNARTFLAEKTAQDSPFGSATSVLRIWASICSAV